MNDEQRYRVLNFCSRLGSISSVHEVVLTPLTYISVGNTAWPDFGRNPQEWALFPQDGGAMSVNSSQNISLKKYMGQYP